MMLADDTSSLCLEVGSLDLGDMDWDDEDLEDSAMDSVLLAAALYVLANAARRRRLDV